MRAHDLVAPEQLEYPLGDGGRVGEPSCAHVTSGQAPLFGLEHVDTAPKERGEVLLDCGVLPHLGVHRRADEHRGARGEQRRREQVVGEAARIAGEQLGGGRRHHHEIGRLAQHGVRDR